MWGTILGLLTSVFGAVASNYFNRRNNEQAAQLNYEYGERSADAAQERQIQTYQRLYSLPAQMEQIEQAGLSAGLIYSGTGGASGATPGAPQGQGAGAQQGKVMDLFAHNELAKLHSEVALNEAQTRKLNADADVVETTGKQEAFAKITQLLSDAGLKGAQQVGQNLQNAFDRIRNWIQEGSKEDQLSMIKYQSQKLYYEMNEMEEMWKQAILKTDFDAATLDERKQMITKELENLCSDLLSKQMNRKIQAAEIHEIYERIAQNWKALSIQEKSLDQQKMWIEEQLKVEWHKMGNDQLNDHDEINDIITNMFGSMLKVGLKGAIP